MIYLLFPALFAMEFPPVNPPPKKHSLPSPFFHQQHTGHPRMRQLCKTKTHIHSLKGYFRSWFYALKVSLLAVKAIPKDPS